MQKKYIVFAVVLGFLVSGLNSWAQKPIRKGMPPITVTKSTAKPLYSIEQLQGKWQETERRATSAKEQKLDFTDTLLIRFDSNKVEIKDATSMRMSMKGVAIIDAPNNLTAAGDEFTINAVEKNKLVLNDGDFIRVLAKKDKFYFETVGKLTVETDTLANAISFDPKNLEGKWIVYRRRALAGSVDPNEMIIKSLEISPSQVSGSATGMVVCYKSDITETLPCKINFGTNSITVETDKRNWAFNIYKATTNEFVFGNASTLLYYSKH